MSSALARSIAALSSRWRNRFSRSKKSPEHLLSGARGEKIAARFLRAHGYKILYRNFRGRTGGEIDLVCRDHDTLVFVEVKTRGSEIFGRPFETIRADQRQRIARGGLAWLRVEDSEILFRFDVAPDKPVGIMKGFDGDDLFLVGELSGVIT